MNLIFQDFFQEFPCSQPALIQLYVEKVLEWNERINITGSKTVESFLFHHIVDVYLAYKHYLAEIEEPSKTWMDVGSGGGLPGMVFSLLNPSLTVKLVEVRKNKATVLQNLIETLGLENQVQLFNQTFESLSLQQIETPLWFRAFLPGQKLLQFFKRNEYQLRNKRIVLMKGPAWRNEKEEIFGFKGLSLEWKKRISDALEISYELPRNLGTRMLVILNPK